MAVRVLGSGVNKLSKEPESCTYPTDPIILQVATVKVPASFELRGLVPAKFMGAVLKMNDKGVDEAVYDPEPNGLIIDRV